jgi:prepilin-type N-terminal cleavage/methylation domain-containing protein
MSKVYSCLPRFSLPALPGLKRPAAFGFLGLKHSSLPAFTLAELLIALAILGVIATFTIPKVLQSQQDGKYSAMAKETMASIAGAYDAYRQNNTVTATTTPGVIVPYMNYVKVDSTGTVIDRTYGSTTYVCSGGSECLVLHNGARLYYGGNDQFKGTASTSAVFYAFDPDGVYGNTTNGPGKSLVFWLYANGRITTWHNADPATQYNSGAVGPCSSCDPPWFSWN